MPDLNDLQAIRKYDTSNMLELIDSFPEQSSAAVRIGEAFALPKSFRVRYNNIVITGLGGSAIGADIAKSYLSKEASAPIFVNRNYTLPAFIGKGSLVIASSYSGNTEETLSAYDEARAKGASIVAITSGGELGRRTERHGVPCMTIPAGLPPRCALGYSFFPLLILLSKIGLIGDTSKEIGDALRTLEDMRSAKVGHKVPQARNIAKSIAKKIHRKCPVIYGSQDHMDAVVTRWRGQFEENAKTLSFSHLLPEMNHNEIMGWEYPAAALKDFIVVMLRDRDDHPRIAKRIAITKKILQGAGVEVAEVVSSGRGDLARVFSLIYTGDCASFYLAILNRTDPTPVDRIVYLKKELGRA